jgi:lysophospholipase L1-like esterase
MPFLIRGDRANRFLRRLRGIASNVALLMASGCFAALVGEAAVRVVAPQQLILIRPDLWQPADTVGWTHRPNVNIEINTGERTVPVLTDSRGFRVGPSGPSTGDTQILILGDSFMEALQVPYEESVAGLLEAALPKELGRPVAIRNAGVGGWDPDQYLLRARALLPSDPYDLVITVLYLGNDVIAARRDYLPPRQPVERYRFHLPRRLSGSELTDAILRPVNDLLEVRSHSYVLVKNRLQTLRMEVGLAAIPFPAQFLTSESETSRWALTADLCDEIGDLAAEHGARALFVFVPTPFQVDPADLMRQARGFDLDLESIDLEQPNRKLGAELTSRGLQVLDPLAEFRAAHAAGQRLFGSVDQHFSSAGNELLARVVAPVSVALLDDQTGGA